VTDHTPTRVEIDPNKRTRHNHTITGLNDADSPLHAGQTVEVFESESGLTGPGRVVSIDLAKELVEIAVDWASLRPSDTPTELGTNTPGPNETGPGVGTPTLTDEMVAALGVGREQAEAFWATYHRPAPADTTLRDRITRAIHRYDYDQGLSNNGVPSRYHRGEADAVLAELAPELADYRNRINWETTRGEHARLLDSCRTAEERAEKAEESRVALADALGEPRGRGWTTLVGRAESIAATASEQRSHLAKADVHRVTLADALGFQAQRTMLGWPALIDAVRVLHALKDDHRTRAETAEAALTRVREQCAEWLAPTGSRSWDAQVRDSIALGCAQMILTAIDGEPADQPDN
jgi:hypothetical protein